MLMCCRKHLEINFGAGAMTIFSSSIKVNQTLTFICSCSSSNWPLQPIINFFSLLLLILLFVFKVRTLSLYLKSDSQLSKKLFYLLQ